jgi:hypothetical protein
MDGRIIYNKDYKVLICLQHQCAIPTSWLERHFRAEHGDCALITRRQIVQEAAKLETVQPDEIIYPNTPVPPVLHLKSFMGYHCNDENCGEITGTIGTITLHCRRNHLWSSKKELGWTEVPVQTLFQGMYKRYDDIVFILNVVISKSHNRIL